MKEIGHVKISRKAYASDTFWNEPRVFSKWESWEWMIQAAAWRDHKRVIGMSIVDLERGEFLASLRFLGEAWGWKKDRVREFLLLLVETGRISRQRETSLGTVYLLANYAIYQNAPSDDQTENQTGRPTDTRQQADSKPTKEKKGKAVKQEKEQQPPGARARGSPTEPSKGSSSSDDDWMVHRNRCIAFVTEQGLGATEKLIAAGEDPNAWRTGSGELVPWPRRLPLLRLAHARVVDGKSPELRKALRYVIPQQLEPYDPPSSSSPKPGTEAAAVRNELPQERRNGPGTGGLVPIGPSPLKEEKPVEDPDVEKVRRWCAENPEETAKILASIRRRSEAGEGPRKGDKARAAWVTAELKSAVLRRIERGTTTTGATA